MGDRNKIEILGIEKSGISLDTPQPVYIIKLKNFGSSYSVYLCEKSEEGVEIVNGGDFPLILKDEYYKLNIALDRTTVYQLSVFTEPSQSISIRPLKSQMCGEILGGIEGILMLIDMTKLCEL